jgi:polyhydroxyalkanoate synthesis repressor PhaR
MAEPRVIKRYANRKLYDTQRSRYVTLDQIAEMVRAGEDVRIVDNNSKDDLTALTLAQILFEQEKKGGFLPLGALRNIIQSGGQSISSIATSAGEKVRAVFRRDKDDKGEDSDEHEAFTDEPEAKIDGKLDDSPGAVKNILERSQQTLDEWQKKVDERVQKVVEALSPFASFEKEVRALRERIAELEKRLEDHDRGR